VTICIGGIPSVSFLIQIGPAVVPPYINMVPVMQLVLN
jgi:hypothetical protein